MWVIIVGDGFGEGNEVAGVFDHMPPSSLLETARKLHGAQFVRAERFMLNHLPLLEMKRLHPVEAQGDQDRLRPGVGQHRMPPD